MGTDCSLGLTTIIKEPIFLPWCNILFTLENYVSMWERRGSMQESACTTSTLNRFLPSAFAAVLREGYAFWKWLMSIYHFCAFERIRSTCSLEELSAPMLLRCGWIKDISFSLLSSSTFLLFHSCSFSFFSLYSAFLSLIIWIFSETYSLLSHLLLPY